MIKLLTCIISILVLVLTGCEPPSDWKTVNIPDGCFVNAAGYEAALLAKQSLSEYYWVKVVVISGIEGYAKAHAICIFARKGRLYAYDQYSGTRLIAFTEAKKDDPNYIAKLWLGSEVKFEKAYFD